MAVKLNLNYVKRTWFSLRNRTVIIQLFTGDIPLLIDAEIFDCSLTGPPHYIPPPYSDAMSDCEWLENKRKHFFAYLSGFCVLHHVAFIELCH